MIVKNKEQNSVENFISLYSRLKDRSAALLLSKIFMSTTITAVITYYFLLPIRLFFIVSGLLSIIIVLISFLMLSRKVFSINKTDERISGLNLDELFNKEHLYSKRKLNTLLSVFEMLTEDDKDIIVKGKKEIAAGTFKLNNR